MPFGAFAGSAALSVTAHVSVAPGALGSAPQLTALTPAPGVTLLAVMPDGSASDTVALVPLGVPPLLPSRMV